MGKNILIVEDEQIIAMEIESYLSSLNYNVIGICSTADEVYSVVKVSDVDLILMDIFLIDSSGIDAAKRAKELKPKLPIIFLSAHMDEETISQAIAINPVAYLVKPFNRNDLSVAIKIGLKQNQISEEHQMRGDIVLDHEFSFDTKSAQLICCGESINLTKKERILLKLFIKHINSLLSITTIEYELWPDKPTSDTRRRSLVSRLRSKLKHKFIETYASEGYILKIKY